MTKHVGNTLNTYAIFLMQQNTSATRQLTHTNNYPQYEFFQTRSWSL